MDNCSKKKDDYFFLSQLIEGMIAQFKGYSNVIILSSNLEYSKLIDILKSMITDLLKDDLHDCNFYTSQIININNTYAVQVNNLTYNFVQKTMDVCPLIAYENNKLLSDKYKILNRKLTKDMNVCVNCISNYDIKNCDKKFFRFDGISDINSLKITGHIKTHTYEYAFFRQLIQKGEDKLTIKYFGISRESKYFQFQIWTCAEYDYLKIDNIYVCQRHTNNQIIIRFFDYIQNILLNNLHDDYKYTIMKLELNN
ncbi:hypothetical protein COBT_003941, partial [Conglomerata obtusa]